VHKKVPKARFAAANVLTARLAYTVNAAATQTKVELKNADKEHAVETGVKRR